MKDENFPTTAVIDSFNNPESGLASPWTQAWKDIVTENSGYEFYGKINVPVHNSALIVDWSYGFQMIGDKKRWFKKAPEGEWEEIDEDAPEAVSFRALFLIRPRVIDDFGS